MRNLIFFAACLLSVSSASAQVDAWAPFADADVVEIITTDADLDLRETKIWIVVLDGSGFVRTNDSRWLANIRRGSDVAIRTGALELAVTATEVQDTELEDQIELAFKTKYGTMQRLMSFFRVSDPTSLRLSVKDQAQAGAGTPSDR